MDIIDQFSHFGLTRQEANLYFSLLTEGELNGYELCKKNGISRSNVYTGLAGLVDKGAAWLLEGESTRYRAVPAGEFTANHLRRLSEIRQDILAKLPPPHPTGGAYLTIRGEQAILDRLRNLVAGAAERVYLSLPGNLVEKILEELQAITARGGKVVAISDAAGIRRIETSCPQAIVHLGQPGTGQIRLIADSHHVLTGELGPGLDPSCLYSNHKNLVDLFKTALKNEIRLIELDQTQPKTLEGNP